MEQHVKPSIRAGLSRKTIVKPLLKSISTPATSKTSTPVLEINMSPDPLSMDNAPGAANGVRRGVGLGSGLRSEANLAKRAARRSPTPTLKSTSTMTTRSRQGSVGRGAKKVGGKDQTKEEVEKEEQEGKIEKGKLGKEAVPVAVQRRSGRNVAALKPVVEEKAKSMKGKFDGNGFYQLGSDTEGETAERGRKKSSREPEGWEKNFLRDLASDMESLDSDGSDLGFKAVSAVDKPAGKQTKKPSKAQTKDKAAPAKNTADPERTMRSSRSATAATAALENDKKAEKGGESKSASVLGKWNEQKQNEKGKSQEKEVPSNKSGESTSSKSSQKGSGKAEPVVVDDMDCEKEDELYSGWGMRTQSLSSRRKPPQATYKSKKERKKELYMSLGERMFYLLSFHGLCWR